MKDVIKMDRVVKFSAVASCARCLCTPRDKSADHQTVACRLQSADYAQKFWHHAIELGAVEAVRYKITYCQSWAFATFYPIC
jgi:hypothetical protein